jgi:ABC-type dipeptide/oligopeptide/nickel transport system permease component
MLNFFFNRLLSSVLVIIAVSIAAFVLLRLSGDLATEYAGENASAAETARVRIELGLDRPLMLQYAAWAASTVQGDLGRSIYTGESVAVLLQQPFALTGLIAAWSLMIALMIGVPLGTLAAWRRNTIVDSLILGLISIGQAVPGFLLAIALATIFGVGLGWLPVSGSESARHLVLPIIAMALAILPALLRMARASMIEVLEADYLEMARAKGLSMVRVLTVHALPNASAPMIALSSVQFGQLLAGSVVIEQVLAIDGVGRLALQSIERVDFPVVQGIVLVLGCIYVVLTLLADLLGMLIDPRLRQR